MLLSSSQSILLLFIPADAPGVGIQMQSSDTSPINPDRHRSVILSGATLATRRFPGRRHYEFYLGVSGLSDA